MSKVNLLIPIAYDNLIDKNLIDTDKASSKIDYYCIGCNDILRLRSGEKKIHHFYHLNQDRRCSLESIKHKLYKKAIIENKQFLTPCGKLLIFDKVEEEKNIFDYRPDIIGYINNKMYIIEIVNTSDITESKLLKIKKSNTVCFSIYSYCNNYQEIIDHIIHKTEFKKYIYTNQIKELDKLKNSLEKEIKYYQEITQPDWRKFNNEVNEKFMDLIKRNCVMNYVKTCSNGSHYYRNEYNNDFVIFLDLKKGKLKILINKLQ
jgi:hypothetical protein